MWFYIVSGVCIYSIYSLYVSWTKPAKYWENKGIDHVKPWRRFFDFFLSGKSFFQGVLEAYQIFPGKRYYGSYQFLRPSVIVKDLDLIKKILVKDFDYFPDHFSVTNEKSDPVMALNLFTLKGKYSTVQGDPFHQYKIKFRINGKTISNIDNTNQYRNNQKTKYTSMDKLYTRIFEVTISTGDKWKDMRTTLSPAFTSSKMKSMFVLITETAENFTKFFQNKSEQIIELEMKDLYSKFTNDVIASCAFGIQCNSLSESDNEFFNMGKEITTFRGSAALRGFFNIFFPKIFELLKLSVFSQNVVQFFRKIVKDTISYREANEVLRPDMIHLLMEARKGRLKREEKDEETAGFATVEESNIGKNYKSNLELTDDVITAQVLIFFFAGFDTSSTMLSLMSYELALNPDIQEKLQAEIDETLKKSGGKIQYDDVLKMKYLDQVVSETLRKYPPGYILNRQCVKDYKIPAKLPGEKDFTIDKGCLLAIPVNGIHLDPQYFPNPDKFDPDRFSEENKANVVPGSYIPFGSGPRNCIGSRFALLESKALTVSLLSKFNVVPVEKTVIPLKFTKSFNLNVKNGVHLGLTKREVE